MKRKIIIGNWKMNKGMREAIKFIQDVDSCVSNVNKDELVIGIAPSFFCLPIFKKMATNIIAVAQNVHFAKQGAYTGEISTTMLQEIGIDFSIVGHSERRQYFNEDNEICNKKLLSLQGANMNAIYCVGESLQEYEEGKGKEVIRQQILDGIKNLSKEYVSSLVIAYEPIWAIGTGKSATSEIANDMATYILEIIKENFNQEIADKVYILYGGSVKPDNIEEYVNMDNIDGVLVGGASLDSKLFIDMVEKLKE